MENKRTCKRWSIEEMMCLYTLVLEKGGKGFEDFLETHTWRTLEAARKRFNLIKSGKITIPEETAVSKSFHTTVEGKLPYKPEEVLFDIEDYEPFKPNIFVRVWWFIKKIFKHND